ncbi:MAG: nitrite reductase [Aeromicrobium sp.]|uniref:nitrite reductase n=1 Tax=Aeromicrobium sp. TaxID=1871063 RepID=UPI0039E3D1D1
MSRDRADRCPGVLRPWIADDGALVRLRLIGGTLPTRTLAGLLAISAEHADGDLWLTSRANVQLRGIAHENGCLDPRLVDAVAASGLLPSPAHELVRNVMVSPLSGRSGGRADLRPVARAYDDLLRADDRLAALSARFLVVLDDGRGDLIDRSLDLGAVAVDATHAQVRIGSHHWGEVVAADELAPALVALAHRFLLARGAGESAAWHVDELPDQGSALAQPHHARDLRTHIAALPLPHGMIGQDDGRRAEHLAVPGGRLTPDLAATVLARADEEVVVTPWRSLILPDLPDLPEDAEPACP